MDIKLNDYLIRRYPKIFKAKQIQGKASWGFECGSGWFKLFDDTCSLIQNHIDASYSRYEKNMVYQSYIDNNKLELLPEYIKNKIINKENDLDFMKEPCPQVVITQIKEKFGSLRIYYDGGDDFCNGIISFAEKMSIHTCEVCGNIGKVRNCGFLKVLCNKHLVKEELEHIKDSEFLNVLLNGSFSYCIITHQISDSEAICQDKEQNKIHAVKIDHAMISYWYGEKID